MDVVQNSVEHSQIPQCKSYSENLKNISRTLATNINMATC